jgi:hypothetical protein
MRRRGRDTYGRLRWRRDTTRRDKRARADGDIGHAPPLLLLQMLLLTVPRPRLMLLLRLLRMMLLRLPPLLLLRLPLRLPLRLLLLLQQHG